MAPQYWKVVGGGEKGGILVRVGQETSSDAASERLATGAFVKQLELRGERLHYFRLSGEGPEAGWVSLKLQGKDLLVKSAAIWEVVGGGGKGGIVVRREVETTSFEEPERLSTGALLEEVDLQELSSGPRLHYRRLTGSGPESGWVSLKFRSTDLVAEAGRNSPDVAVSAQGKKITRTSPDQTAETAKPLVRAAALEGDALAELNMKYDVYADGYFKRLRGGEIVGPLETYPARREAGEVKGGSPGKPSGRPEAASSAVIDPDLESRRAVVEANRRAEPNPAKQPPPYVRLSKKDMLAKATQVMDGDMYGIPVPPTLDELQRMGASWLTKAFLAAGTLKAGNSVKRVVEFKKLPTTTADAAGGQGPKAFLTVEYEIPDNELHNELFVKMPWAADGGTREDGVAITDKGMDDYPEIAFYLNMGPLVPFKMPKFYFAEICRANTNSVIIIEKLKFGKKGQEKFEPYEVLPLAEKYFDSQLSPLQQSEMYYSLCRAQARLGAWYQLGYFDNVPKYGPSALMPVAGMFEWPTKMAEKAREQKAKGGKVIWGFWHDFLGTHAKRCYPTEYTEAKFYSALQECIEDVVTYNDDIRAYFNMFPEYISMQHPNLNADNAFFWWNSGGNLDCGIFDFAGGSPMNCISAMLGSLTGAEGDVQFEHDVQWLRCFRDEYYQECGLKLDLGEMQRQWHLTYGTYLVYLGMSINSSVFPQTTKAEWETIQTLWDERVVGRWNVRCYTFMVNISLRYLYLGWVKGGKKRLHIHDTLLQWVAYWKKQGLS